MKGFALYSKDGRMFVFEVLYEFNDSQFVGFRRQDEPYNGNFYEIRPVDGGYKVIMIDLPNKSRMNAPTGKKYTQLPGGGGGYKVTRQYSNANEMIKNPTVIGILDRYFGAMKQVRTEIRKHVGKIFEAKKQHVAFVAASVEDGGEIEKMENAVKKYVGELPEGWVRTKFKDGRPDFHMSIRMGGNSPFFTKKELINKDVELKIVAIGKSDKAIAFKEEGDMYSDKDIKHITIGFNKAEGGGPNDSDMITEWKPIEPFEVKAIIRQFDTDKNVVLGINLKERGSEIVTGNFPETGTAAGTSPVFPK